MIILSFVLWVLGWLLVFVVGSASAIVVLILTINILFGKTNKYIIRQVGRNYGAAIKYRYFGIFTKYKPLGNYVNHYDCLAFISTQWHATCYYDKEELVADLANLGMVCENPDFYLCLDKP